MTPGDTADVVGNDTTVLNLDVKRGYRLNMISGDLGAFHAATGTSVNLVMSEQPAGIAVDRDRDAHRELTSVYARSCDQR